MSRTESSVILYLDRLIGNETGRLVSRCWSPSLSTRTTSLIIFASKKDDFEMYPCRSIWSNFSWMIRWSVTERFRGVSRNGRTSCTKLSTTGIVASSLYKEHQPFSTRIRLIKGITWFFLSGVLLSKISSVEITLICRASKALSPIMILSDSTGTINMSKLVNTDFIRQGIRIKVSAVNHWWFPYVTLILFLHFEIRELLTILCLNKKSTTSCRIHEKVHPELTSAFTGTCWLISSSPMRKLQMTDPAVLFSELLHVFRSTLTVRIPSWTWSGDPTASLTDSLWVWLPRDFRHTPDKWPNDLLCDFLSWRNTHHN